jgi:hypothetical protein
MTLQGETGPNMLNAVRQLSTLVQLKHQFLLISDTRLYFLRILGDFPNTYAYTKALSEGLVAEQMDKLPVLILRPSIGKSLFYVHNKLLL